MLHLLRINVWPLSCEAVFLHSEAVAEIHIWSIVRSEDQYNYKKTDLVKNQIKAQFCSHCLNLVPSSHRLARNEAEVWRRRGSPGPGKPARWRWRRRIGLALPLWPLPVWRQLPLQVPPKLERRTWRPGGGRGAGTGGGGRSAVDLRRSLPQYSCSVLDTVLSATWNFWFLIRWKMTTRTSLWRRNELVAVEQKWSLASTLLRSGKRSCLKALDVSLLWLLISFLCAILWTFFSRGCFVSDAVAPCLDTT